MRLTSLLALAIALPACAQTISPRLKATTLVPVTAAPLVSRNDTGTQGPAGPQGPTGATGATGPQGPAGMALPPVLIVPATADPAANGAALLAVLNTFASTPATAAQPYVVQLDAGVYALPSTATLPPYVSLTGAGMLASILEGNLSLDNSTSTTSKQSITNLGILASTGAPLAVQLGKFLILDHVQLSGGTSSLTATTGNAHFLISNSILGSFSVNAALATGAVQGATVSTIVTTQMDPVSISMPSPAVLNCLADYTSTGVTLPVPCQ